MAFIMGSVYIFFLIQLFPIFHGPVLLEEKRTLAPYPSFSMSEFSSYPKKFDEYYKDNFVFRDFFIQANNYVKFRIFNISGSSKVLVGKEGWLFYNADEARDGSSFSNHLGLLPGGYLEYFEEYKSKLERKQSYLASLGIKYVFVVAPDKWSVYPEYLPNGYRNEFRMTSVDILLNYLQNYSNVNILDLRKKIIEIKKNSDDYLFYKGDTHWNELGGYYAYYEIAKYLKKEFKNIVLRKKEDYNIKKIYTKESMDLAKIIGLKEYKEIDYIIEPVKPYTYITLHNNNEDKKTHYYKKNDNNLPKVLVFRDSFMNAIIPHLAEDFSSSIFVWSKWNNIKEVDPWLKKDKPDIVIEETVERYLMPSVKF